MQVTPNDIKGNTTLGDMFHTQSIYMMTSTAEIPIVMSCMTFDPPVPVESGIDNQVRKSDIDVAASLTLTIAPRSRF